MAVKVDYKEYLKQFGQIETDAKNRIKAYLEEQIQNDEALKALYRPEKIDDCYDFIKNAVKATGCGSSATIDDAVVFKMARDFYLDYAGAETATEAETEAETELETEEEKPADNENSGTPCEEAESENEKPAESEDVMLHQADNEGESAESDSEAETESATEEEKPTDNENEAEKDYCGFEVFGEDAPEACAETEASAETKAEPENEKPEPEAPKYDKDGNGLLFGF
jgi:hypothetical protein